MINRNRKFYRLTTLALALVTLVTLVLLTLGWVNSASFSPTLAAEATTRVLVVHGQGTVAVPTTLTQVQLGVEVEGKTAAAVQQQVAQQSAAVVKFLQAQSVEELGSKGIQLQPNYRYENGVRRLQGYRASNLVSFQVPTEKAGEIIDGAIAAGGTRVDGVAFLATEAVLAQARQQALKGATQEAQSQADVVLESLGLSPQEVVGIQVNEPQPYTPMPLKAETSLAAASTPVIGGKQQVRGAVTLRIRY